MKPDENQSSVSEPSPNIVTSSQPPTTDTATQSSSTNPTPVNTIPAKSHKKAIVALVVVLVVLLVGGGAFALYRHNHKAKPVASSSTVKTSSTTKSPATSTASTNNGLLTYVSTDNSNLIVTDNNQKVLAKITNPAGNNGFDVLSNNGQNVLIAAGTSSGNNEPEYLVNYKGTVTKLPASVSSPSVTGTSSGQQFLGYSNDYVENSCTNDSQGDTLTCYIDNVNLSTGSVSVVTSFSNSTSNPSENPPTAILGVSPQNIVYVLYDSSSDTTGTNPVIKEINLNNQQTINTVKIPGGATNGAWIYYALSSNFDYYANVAGVHDNQIQITNLNTGSTSTVNDQCSSGIDSTASNLYWSPDNSKIAYDCYSTDGSFAAYIDATSDGVTQLKSMSTSNLGENFNVEGWSSNRTINYYYASGNATTPSSWEFYSSDTTSGTVNSSPTPTGYWFVTGLGL